ncbi:MAG: hypothetical protein ACTHL8_20830 [Burkholderiaceae bacterium]
MNPTPAQVLDHVKAGRLARLLRGELAVFTTPAEINADMRPTDHAQLLEAGLYPLVPTPLRPEVLSNLLQQALLDIAVDARGVFCAVQCFYLEVVDEDGGRSPLRLDRDALFASLYAAFLAHEQGLHALAFRPRDLVLDRCHKLTAAAFRVLARDHGLALPSGGAPAAGQA